MNPKIRAIRQTLELWREAKVEARTDGCYEVSTPIKYPPCPLCREWRMGGDCSPECPYQQYQTDESLGCAALLYAAYPEGKLYFGKAKFKTKEQAVEAHAAILKDLAGRVQVAERRK